MSLKGKKSSDKEFYFKRLKEYCESHGGKLISKEWKTAKTIYEIKCGNPEHPVFTSSADSLISGSHWCPYCCGRKGNFQEEIEQIIKNNNGTLMSEYKKSNEHVKVKCNIHNYIWDILPLNIKKNRWCPICNLPFSEKVVWDYLNDNHILCDIQYKFDDLLSKNDEMLKFDFVIYNKDKSIKFLLEVDDCEHWYNHKSKRRIEARNRDKLKDEYCKINNIILYRMIYPYRRNIPSYGEYYNYINSQLSNLIKKAS